MKCKLIFMALLFFSNLISAFSFDMHTFKNGLGLFFLMGSGIYTNESRKKVQHIWKNDLEKQLNPRERGFKENERRLSGSFKLTEFSTNTGRRRSFLHGDIVGNAQDDAVDFYKKYREPIIFGGFALASGSVGLLLLCSR